MRDKQLEDFLRDCPPQVKEGPEFMLEVQRRMHEVEGLKSEVDRQRGNRRRVLIVALLSGMALGALAAAIGMFFPADILPGGPDSPYYPSIKELLINAVIALGEWKYLLMLFIAGCAILFGLLPLSEKHNH